MTYEEALKYLNSFINYEKIADYPSSRNVFGLKRIKLLLEKLGNPHHGLRAIHIAGSKGKGSVACFCASILKEAGFKTGLYTSPHLESFRERIGINGEFISQQDIVELIQLMKPCIDEDEAPSFFEVYTALAFLYFKRKNIDLAVIEVGLGGRLDATNVINPLVCVVTPVSLEHTKKLGNTLGSIAGEKSGIIKEKSLVVSSMQEKEVLDIIKQTAGLKQAPVYVVGENIFYQNLIHRQGKQIFNIKGIFEEYNSLEINLLGEHQVVNAITAVGAIEALRFCDVVVSKQAIKEGLSKAFWPGRIEVVMKRPFIVLDGAQNVASAHALVKTVEKSFSYHKLILVLGISKDKDIAGMIKVLERIADEVIITRAGLPRAAEPVFLSSFFQKDKDIKVTQSVKESLIEAKKRAKKNDLILICGSLFVVAEARRELVMPEKQGIQG